VLCQKLGKQRRNQKRKQTGYKKFFSELEVTEKDGKYGLFTKSSREIFHNVYVNKGVIDDLIFLIQDYEYGKILESGKIRKMGPILRKIEECERTQKRTE